MALDHAEYDAYQAAIAQQRADAAAEWDDAHPTKPADVAADVRGPLVEPSYEILGYITPMDGARVGPLEFKGKEDFIRGGYQEPPTACLRGCDIVGTVPQAGSKMGAALLRQTQSTGFVRAKTPAGKPIIAQAVKKTKPLDHKQSIANAQLTAKRLTQIASKLKDAVKKGGAKKILGDDDWLDLVGAAFRRNLPHMSPAQLTTMASKLEDTAKKLSTSADKHKTFVSKTTDAQKKGADKAKKAYGPSGKKGTPVIVGAGNRFGDEWFELVGKDWVDLVGKDWVDLMGLDWVDLVGQMMPPTPDPNNPGYYTDGTPDTVDAQVPDQTGNMVANPNYQAGGSTMPGSSGAGSIAASVPGPPDYGVGSPPALSGSTITESDGSTWPQQGVDYIADPYSDPSQDQQTYSADENNIPMGAVYYDPNVMGPLPWQGVGSFHRFYPQADNGDGKGNSGFQWGGGDPGIMDGWYWWFHGATSGTEYKHENAGNNVNLPSGAPYGGAQDLMTRQKASIALGWGPLIGNPGLPQTKGLRLDASTGNFFWYWNDAPLQAQMAGTNGLQAKLNKDLLDYNTALAAGKGNYAQAVAQDQLNAKTSAQMQAQQAQEDAQAQHQIELAQAQAQAQQPGLQNQEQQQQLQLQQQLMQQQQQQQALQYQQQQAETQAYTQWLQQPAGGAAGAGMPMMPGMPADGGGMDQGYGGGMDQGGDQGGPFDDVQNQMPQYADTAAFDQAVDAEEDQ